MPLTIALAKIWIACLSLMLMCIVYFGTSLSVLTFGVLLIPPLAFVVCILELLGAFKALSKL